MSLCYHKELLRINFLLTYVAQAFHQRGGRSLRAFMMSDHLNYERTLTGVSSQVDAYGSAESDEFRTRATRYRNLAETLLDPRVIAVVESCARELEMEAMLVETAEDAYCVIPPIRG